MQEINTHRVEMDREATLNACDIIVLGKEVLELLQITDMLTVKGLDTIAIYVKIPQIGQTLECV